MEPNINVGIVSGKEINFTFNGTYSFQDQNYKGKHKAELAGHEISFNGKSFNEIQFLASADASFDLEEVVIGVGFHWQRKEIQRFKGDLKLIIEGDKITAINVLPIEDYLSSVISSEMSATSSLELLKAHAVTSRSWLLSQLEAKKEHLNTQTEHLFRNNGELIKWYDKDDHVNFDVCADDHCQRYQGITRQTTPKVAEAIKATAGQVLLYSNKICDARFSKCCGGIAETFDNCWESIVHPYLQPIMDNKKNGIQQQTMSEKDAKQFILNPPKDDFCDTTDKETLSQVLNSYDQETPDFYRWRIVYTQEQIADLLKRKSGIDFGNILDLQPIERGYSARIVKLKIIGSKQTITVGKELEIRKWLSESHLYSSAFIVEKSQDAIPKSFTLHGAGWGHGVGLCQIGAAVMATKGYNYKEILSHYFRNTDLKIIY